MTDDPFEAPPPSGDMFNNDDNEGRLLLITPHEYDPAFVTKHGPGPAVRADVVVLDGPEAPTAYQDTMLFGLVFTGQLRRKAGTGGMILGRIGKGQTSTGKTPWMLAEPTDADRTLARAHLNTPAKQTPTKQPAFSTEPPF